MYYVLTLWLIGWFKISTMLPASQQPHIYVVHDSYPPEVRQQVAFYAHHFNFDETVHIRVALIHNLPDNLDGFIVYHKDEKRNIHLIYIRIRKNITSAKRRHVIAHEMIHAKQYVTQELQIVGTFHVLWKEQSIPDFRQIKYHHRAWEREAFSQTAHLVKLFNKIRMQ